MKTAVFNKSLTVGSGLTARPGTVLTAGRSYTWLIFTAQAKESVLWIEEIGFSGCTPFVAAGLNPFVNPTNQMFADDAESEAGESVPRALASSAPPMGNSGARVTCYSSFAVGPSPRRLSPAVRRHVSYQVETGTKASRRSIIGGWNRCLFPVFGLTHEHGVILSQG